MPDFKECSFCKRRVNKLAAPSRGLCAACYYRERRNGQLEYIKVRKLCSIDGCDKLSVAQGFCSKHYSRLQRHGITEEPRLDNWGHASVHPLYDSHQWIVKRKSNAVDPRWKDFWTFVKDVGDRPSPRHMLWKRNGSLPIGPDNFYWREPKTDVRITDREARNEYMRTYRLKEPDRFRSLGLKKQYGIDLEQYKIMLDAQNGVCAICEKAETTVIRGKLIGLAVDHCHTSGGVRELLCRACNNILGDAKDDPERLRRAIAYLERHKEQSVG